MATARFCPSCGAARIEGTRFSGGCGADLAAPGVPTAPGETGTQPQVPAVIERQAAPHTVVHPAEVVYRTVPGVRLAQRRPLLLVGLVAFLVIAAGVGVGAAVLLKPSATAGPVVGTPFPSPIALTSPPASQVPAGLADPSTPAYQVGSGFTPDAVRVLTVTVLRLSLEQYRAAHGSYPADLSALFPDDAPTGAGGTPMASPPSAADGYTYTTTGDVDTLAVVLASGQSYTTSNPREPRP